MHNYWLKRWLYQRCREASIDNDACGTAETCKKCRYWFPIDEYDEISVELPDDLEEW